MRQVLIVTYDLHEPGQNYEPLLQELKSVEGWARLGRSAYLVSTEMTPVQLRDKLNQVLDKNDRLFVGVAPAPSAWRGMPEDVSKWIHEHQK